jgi:hypothetical protein
MPYKKKNPSPNPKSDSSSGAPSDPEPELVETEVQQHAAPSVASSFIDRAKNKLVEMGTGEASSFSEPVQPKSKWKNYAAGKKKKQNEEQFATLVTTIFVLTVSAWDVPETVKPIDDEIEALSSHLSGLILRHFPIADGMTEDAIDIIGILTVSVSYYHRVGPELRKLRGNNPPPASGPRPPTPPQPRGGNHTEYVEHVPTPIEAVSPTQKAFLDHVAAEVESGD